MRLPLWLRTRGPYSSIELPYMIGLLTAAVVLAWLGAHVTNEAAAGLYVGSGVCLGGAAGIGGAARGKDEAARREIQRATRALVDNDVFGGWRRH